MRKILLIILSLIFISVTTHVLSQESSNLSSIHQKVTIDYTKEFWITSEKVSGQQYLIKVLLPRSYFKSDTSAYPILYVTDADLFFGTASDCAYWLGRGKTEIILVGISYGSPEICWKRRHHDLRPFINDKGVIGSEHFLAFIRDELIPKIESEFRIDSSNRTLFGFSAGGRFTLYTLFQQPQLFKNYLALGVPLTDRNRWAFEMEENYFQKRKDLPVQLYMGVGDYDVYSYPSFLEFVQILENRKYEGLKFKWEVLKGKRHEYKTVAELMINGLDYVYGNTSICSILIKIIKGHGIEKAIAEYQRIKRMHPNEYNFNESELDWLGNGLLLFSNRITEAIEIFKLNADAYPDSWIVYDRLGEAYMKSGNKELAVQNFKKSLELNSDNTNALEKLKKLKE